LPKPSQAVIAAVTVFHDYFSQRGKPQPKSEPRIARMTRMGRRELPHCSNCGRPIRVIRAIRDKKIFAKLGRDSIEEVREIQTKFDYTV